MASTSYRLASRIANTLHAGNPVREFAELQVADVILVCIPGGPVSSLIQLDALNWRDKLVLVCDSPNDPYTETALCKRGALVCAIHPIPDLPGRHFVVGDRAAVRLAKSLVHSVHESALEVSRPSLPLFQSALTLSGSFFTPLLETAVECLRQSGLAQPEAAKLAESLFQHSLRTFKHAGRKSWAGPVAVADDETLLAQERALHAVKPLMASYFHHLTRCSFDLYQTFPELTRYNTKRWTEFRKRYKQSS